ncbi:MAG TPA: porin family protein, partial [Reyranella sp.]|nr:porin family protein [Reyranella sp.]
MKHASTCLRAIVFMLVLVAPHSSFAQPADRGWYAGGSFGGFKAHEFCDPPSNPAIVLNSCDDSTWGVKAFAGYQINRNFAIEGDAIKTGDIKANVTSGGFTADLRSDAYAFGANVLGIIPMNTRFSVFGKVGVSYIETEARVTVGGLNFVVGDDSTELKFGAGLLYNLSDRWALRGEWERV